jgi:hypothetical protein
MPLKKKREKKLRGVALAVKIAGDIAEAGLLRVVERDDNPPGEVCAKIRVYTRLRVTTKIEGTEPPVYYSEWKEFRWWVNLRPKHFPASVENPGPLIPEAHQIHSIEFWFAKKRSCRHLADPSTHLTIKSWE